MTRLLIDDVNLLRPKIGEGKPDPTHLPGDSQAATVSPQGLAGHGFQFRGPRGTRRRRGSVLTCLSPAELTTGAESLQTISASSGNRGRQPLG
jgi:hypothetical protein